MSLTGSEPAGAAVAALAGKYLKRSVLELGGKDAFIVLEDADLQHAIEHAVKGRIVNAGQSCVASKRFIVVQSVADAFIAGFREQMAALKMGDPLDEDTTLSPLSTEDAAVNLLDQVRSSINAGATVLLGGDRPDREGAYFHPTILTDVTPDNPTFDQELFGPVATMNSMNSMNQSATHLLSEFRWDGLVAKNRIVMSPMTRGRASHSDFLDGQLPVAPSPVCHTGDSIFTPSGEKKAHETPRPLETDEIPRLVEDYRAAAARAQAAGFDGIEIHSANGYLLDEFLQSKTNHRTDQYGGSLENRFRLLREVIEACQSVFDASRIGVRLSPNGMFNDMGSPDFRETFLYAAEQLSPYQLAWLDVLDGLAFGFHELGEPITLQDLRTVYDGRLMANCGYDRDQAEAVIAAGLADLVAFGRPFISNPDLVARFANNWPLNQLAPQEVWYSSGTEGYTDFPTYQESEANQTAFTT